MADRRHQGRDQARLARAGESLAAGDHFVEHRAKREDVGARVALFPFELLWSHVLKSAENRAFGGERVRDRGQGRVAPRGRRSLRNFGQAEIEQFGPGAGEHDVARLEVAMNHALAVRGVQGAGDLDSDAQRFGHRQRSVAEALFQAFALQMFHHQELLRVLTTDVVERADVRVVQAGNGPRFTFEAIGETDGADLNGYGAVKAGVARLIDVSHAAGPQWGDDLIGA